MDIEADILEIDALVEKAKQAQAVYEAQGSQKTFDLACQAVAWALITPEHNSSVSKLAGQKTGLGNASEKKRKNHNKTVGLLRDLKGGTAFGHE